MNHTSQLEAFIYFSNSGSGSGSGFRFRFRIRISVFSIRPRNASHRNKSQSMGSHSNHNNITDDQVSSFAPFTNMNRIAQKDAFSQDYCTFYLQV